MGVRGIISFLFRRSLEIAVVVALIGLFPRLPPFVNIKEPFRVAPLLPFEGKLALKESFGDVEILHKGEFVGPESFAELGGELYTTIHGGDIVKLSGNHITPITKFGKPCKGLYEEAICGRPLGIDVDKNGYLYAADAYYGLFKVDIKTGGKEQIVSPLQEINGKTPKLFNSVAVASNGDIYWSDSSSDFKLENGIYVLLADPSGRLIRYDAKTKQNTVLIDNIHFANGVSLSDDEEFILIAETARSRIHRYYLKGPKKGTHDIFIDGLPGVPDNITPDGKGGFLVPLIFGIDSQYPALYQTAGPLPWIRKLVARFMAITEYLIDTLNQAYPTEFGFKCVHFIGHFASIPLALQNPRMTILRLNKNGEIIDSIHSLNRKIQAISEAYIFHDMLYLGSPFNDYIGRIPLSKVGWDNLKVEKIKKAPPTATVSETNTPEPVKRSETIKTTQKPTISKSTQAPTTTAKPPASTTQKSTTSKPTEPSSTAKPPTTKTSAPTTAKLPTTTTSAPTTAKLPTTTTKAPTAKPPTPSAGTSQINTTAKPVGTTDTKTTISPKSSQTSTKNTESSRTTDKSDPPNRETSQKSPSQSSSQQQQRVKQFD
ncbi:adipocyte plasma membrane-associated protein Hemomucin-like [Cylas formicarius]|uniref:adipocyte plasma membrane-associated protein Hemomucin-like n=1 Tax=Cylas formicarius TaxID=197179 RepID=UPI0029589EA4|nr:adipocyte plasma membrane-associated protein Hemomucin-like [Cylas formicarius]